MAGGKESPRQKMIGMMYLVLTALLALQVSSAIMEKFKFLDDSLQFANGNADKGNIRIEKSIEKIVTEGGNKPKDVLVLQKAQQVRKEAAQIKEYLLKTRKNIIEITGGYEDNNPEGMYKGAKEETQIEVLMVGAQPGKGEGYKMKDEINKYCDDLSKVTGKQYKHIALDAKDDDRISKKSEQKKKDFAELNFAQTPMVAAMAVISNLEAEVLKHETDALGVLAGEIGADEIKFDQIVPMYKAESKVVAAGTKYNAELFLGASSSTLKPTITVDGRSLQVDPQGKGKLEFTASGGSYDKEGNVKKRWTGKITIKNKGKDTTFTVDGEYVVAKPVISVQSASVSALYKNCGNELNIQVPALGSTYNPSFTASGASVIRGAQKGFVTLVPTGAKVTINVASNGTNLGSQDFGVRLIPKPTIEALTNGAPVNEKTGMAAPGPRSITMKAVPDDGFKTFLPKDARYRVAQWDCILVRGKRPVATQNVTSETANLSSFAAQAQPGDRILIEVKKVTRTNFMNQVEDVSLGTIIKNIPIN
jgi:gliding motility-associated protein GldM